MHNGMDRAIGYVYSFVSPVSIFSLNCRNQLMLFVQHVIAAAYIASSRVKAAVMLYGHAYQARSYVSIRTPSACKSSLSRPIQAIR
jgi:hypothetical protein